MLSKVLAGLMATVAVAFASYTFVHDSSGSGCCASRMQLQPATSESCSESAAPSCCHESIAAPEASCDAVCPAAKAAAAAKTPVDDDDDQ
jgi:hypothetical protein